MSDFFRRLAEALAQGGGAQFGGNTYGGNQFGASAQPPTQPPSISPALRAPDLSGYSLGPRPGGPAYLQPFQGPHNEPYLLDALVRGAQFGLPVSPGQPGVVPASRFDSNSVFEAPNQGNRMQMPSTPAGWTGEGRGGFSFNPLAMGIPQRDQVQAATMPPSQPVSAPPQIAQANPQASVMGFDSIPPVSMEMQGMAAPMPTGRNELERDYYAQLAQNPNGFNKGWLGRLFG